VHQVGIKKTIAVSTVRSIKWTTRTVSNPFYLIVNITAIDKCQKLEKSSLLDL